jgi:hypothetical protein
MYAYDEYPWGYNSNVKKNIEGAVEDELTEKNTKNTLTNAVTKKKTPKEMVSDMGLKACLALLKPRGVQNVAAELYSLLFRIQKSEAKTIKDDPVKAAAYGKLFLTNFEEAAVRSFMQWMYGGQFEDHGAEEMYALLMLATELQVVALMEACMTKLCGAVTANMEQARSSGIPLRALLGYGSGPPENSDIAIGVVIGHAFKNNNIPRRLFKLVVDTLADDMDAELFVEIKDLISRDMAIQLLEAILARQKAIKGQLYDHACVKSEGEGARAGT